MSEVVLDRKSGHGSATIWRLCRKGGCKCILWDRSSNFRLATRAMATNVKWILDQEGPESKIMLWGRKTDMCPRPPLRRGGVHWAWVLGRGTYGEKMGGVGDFF